jgi:hypothetical protein
MMIRTLSFASLLPLQGQHGLLDSEGKPLRMQRVSRKEVQPHIHQEDVIHSRCLLSATCASVTSDPPMCRELGETAAQPRCGVCMVYRLLVLQYPGKMLLDGINFNWVSQQVGTRTTIVCQQKW